MRAIIKKTYMILFHPYIFLMNFCVKGLFIKTKSNITHLNQINFGSNVQIGSNVRINFFDKHSILDLCDGVYIVNRCSFLVGADIYIGTNTLIASDVCISSENHGINAEDTIPYKNQPLVCQPVNIGDGCWIGEKTIILPGVRIGNKCVIGAGSVVTHNIPDYSMAVGNPAKIIKKYDFVSHNWNRV